jgi:hypothetical protein
MVFCRSHAKAVALVMLGYPLIGVDVDRSTPVYLFDDLARQEAIRWSEVSREIGARAERELAPAAEPPK